VVEIRVLLLRWLVLDLHLVLLVSARDGLDAALDLADRALALLAVLFTFEEALE
jgi:hypothetical protein